MTTSDDIAIKVREVLVAANISGASVVWARQGYEKTNEIVIVPHRSDGEGSLRDAVVMVNIHVPDKPNGTAYEPDFIRLNTLHKAVISALKNYYWRGTGINWEISSLDPSIKEPDHNEHFKSVRVTAHIREK